MCSPFDHLNLDRELACEFLGIFARYEYALKAVGFANGDDRDVKAAWDQFARSIDAKLAQLDDEDLRTAATYLLREPPKKQILQNKRLRWLDSPPDANLPQAEQVLLMVRRVRNNLFHGGKFLEPQGNGERDHLLVSRSLTVLLACLPLNTEVEAAYRW